MIKLVGKLGGWIERGGKLASPPGVETLEIDPGQQTRVLKERRIAAGLETSF